MPDLQTLPATPWDNGQYGCQICGELATQCVSFASTQKSTLVYFCDKHYQLTKLLFNDTIVLKNIDLYNIGPYD